MFRSTLLVAATALLGLVNAQNYSTSGPLSITVSQVPIVLREAWCRAQENSCPEICGGKAFPNTCNTATLSYTCTCTNGNKPNISSYEQTIPFFVCEQWKTNCVDNNPNNLKAQTACLSVVCGQKNASTGEVASTASASASSSPKATGKSHGGSGGSGSAAHSSSSAGVAAATHLAQNYGTHILAGGMLAVFGLAL